MNHLKDQKRSKEDPMEISSDSSKVQSAPVWQIRLRSEIPHMGAVERRISEYIINNPEKIIYQSITEVAEASDASEATIVRLSRRLGYKGFQGLKIALAKNFIPSLRVIHENLNDGDDIATIKDKVFFGSLQALQDTRVIVDNVELRKAIDAIYQANKIDIYGVGGSACIAEDAHHKFMKIGIRSNVYHDSNLQAMSAALLTKKDLALGISHSGSVRDVVEALQIAKNSGATTICITHLAKSPITETSDIKLFTSSNEMMFRSDAMSSRIAQLAIIDTIYVGVALKLGETASQNLETVRQATACKGF